MSVYIISSKLLYFFNNQLNCNKTKYLCLFFIIYYTFICNYFVSYNQIFSYCIFPSNFCQISLCSSYSYRRKNITYCTKSASCRPVRSMLSTGFDSNFSNFKKKMSVCVKYDSVVPKVHHAALSVHFISPASVQILVI